MERRRLCLRVARILRALSNKAPAGMPVTRTQGCVRSYGACAPMMRALLRQCREHLVGEQCSARS
jgi:hypothetical protein